MVLPVFWFVGGVVAETRRGEVLADLGHQASLRVRIHRGAHQIGGSCVELSYGNARLLLDLGKPLETEDTDRCLLPPVLGLADGANASLRGIIGSHGHIDHWGLVPLAHNNIPLRWAPLPVVFFMRRRRSCPKSLHAGGYRRSLRRRIAGVRPFHGHALSGGSFAFDAYALLVEAAVAFFIQATSAHTAERPRCSIGCYAIRQRTSMRC